MAFDYGSIELNITNPFRFEGFVRALGGIACTLIGIWMLFQVSPLVESDLTAAWIHAGAGFIILATGLKRCGGGLFQTFRFFVGRSVPCSLAQNHAKSEKHQNQKEKAAYTAQTLESMLMGRKNPTFQEPKGWISRLIHTLFPRLIFLPYPIRNLAQDIAGALVSTCTAIVAFGLAYFISLSGLAGNAGHLIVPIMSFSLLLYLITTWAQLARPAEIASVKGLASKGSGALAKVLALAILLPLGVGFAYHKLISNPKTAPVLEKVTSLVSDSDIFATGAFLLLLGVLATVIGGAMIFLVAERTKSVDSTTEVSEFRRNYQESIHPREIFVNLESIVLANRRYKEIPNRVYSDQDPKLEEQSEAKGSFGGEMIIETQPEYQTMNYRGSYKRVRSIATVTAQLLLIISSILFARLAIEISQQLPQITALFQSGGQVASSFDQTLFQMLEQLSMVKILGLCWLIVAAFAHTLANQTHLFWAEMLFSSMLVYLKTDGTYTESRVSTGTSIYDSTRSENTVVRSSITPWIVSSRVTTSTFATSGMHNLELPRYVMTMKKNDDELGEMVKDIESFLKDRENIAGIKNDKDLSSANEIFQVNQQTRAHLDRNKRDHALPEEAAKQVSDTKEAEWPEF